jgi:hypothetical protein
VRLGQGADSDEGGGHRAAAVCRRSDVGMREVFALGNHAPEQRSADAAGMERDGIQCNMGRLFQLVVDDRVQGKAISEGALSGDVGESHAQRRRREGDDEGEGERAKEGRGDDCRFVGDRRGQAHARCCLLSGGDERGANNLTPSSLRGHRLHRWAQANRLKRWACQSRCCRYAG